MTDQNDKENLSRSETEPGSILEPEPEPETVSESPIRLKPKLVLEPEPETPTWSNLKLVLKTESESPTGSKSDPTTGSNPDPTIGSKSDPTTGSKSDPTIGSKSNPTTGSNPDPTIGSKSDPTTGSNPDPTIGSKSEKKSGSTWTRFFGTESDKEIFELDDEKSELKLAVEAGHRAAVAAEQAAASAAAEATGEGWTEKAYRTMFANVQKLKYNRVITNYFLYELKSYEGKWTWVIILISTITSGITLLNNVEEEELPFPNMKTYVNISLTVGTMMTTLIASWIKKQQYVVRINELDRYTQKINKLCEELLFELNKPDKDKVKYSDFTKKYFPLISEYLSTTPSISPKEWKKCIHGITEKYPELLTMDYSNVEKLWPWFTMSRWGENEERYPTGFGRVYRCWCRRIFCRRVRMLD